MANIEITNNATNGVVIWDPVFNDEVGTFTLNEVWPEGAVLGRITASGKLVRFDPAASDGSEVAVAVLTQQVDATAAGDYPIRPAISGRVRQRELKDKDGTALTKTALEQLRGFTIIALPTEQLSELDNQ